MPKISVIIPLYNVEQYVRECLDSVVNQTFRDLEIICVNDGSTDGTLAILEEYAAKDSRIRVITQKNEGQGEAKNVGLSAATGDYIQFVDSDDYLDLNACQTAYSKAVETKSDMTMFLFQFFGAFEKRSSDSIQTFPSELITDIEKIQYEIINWQTAWSNLFLRSFIEKNNLRYHKGLLFDDVPFVIKAALLANKIAIVPQPLYYYRQRDESIMGDKKKVNYLSRPACFQAMFEDIMPLTPNNDALLYLLKYKYNVLYEVYYNRIDKRYRSEMGRRIKKAVTVEELQLIVANEKSFEPNVFSFFVKNSGSFKLRCKYFKNCFADSIVKKLIPHSPWLQHTLEIVDSQREQIQTLQEQLKK